MEEYFVWATTRRIRPDTLDDFEEAWQPTTHPQGMHRAFAYWSEDGQEITGVSFWVSEETCDAWRASEPETQRRAAMAPYVVEEREGFYRGRELAVPGAGPGRAGL
jgi:heme-degrading monooxygenase HmoA